MKIFVLNLERAKDRRAFMEKQSRQKGFAFDFVNGIDYRNMSASDFNSFCVSGTADQTSMVKGVRAASLSHLKMYEAFLATDDEFGVFLEDDVVLESFLPQVLNCLKLEDLRDSPILLRYYCHKPSPLALSSVDALEVPFLGKDGKNMALLKPLNINHCASAAAYVLHRNVAKRMVDRLYPVEHVPDQWQLFYRKGCFSSLYCMYPQLASDASFVPIIEYPDTKLASARFKSILRRLLPLPLIELRSSRRHNVRHTLRVLDFPTDWQQQE